MLGALIEEHFLPYFFNAETPRQDWKTGLEQEVIGFKLETNQRLTYQEDLLPILQGFAERFGWKPYYEGENLIGLKKNRSSITMEPGGQLELSLCPIGCIADVKAELLDYQEQLRQLSEGRGIYWLSMGYDPFSKPEDVALVPKQRYVIMDEYLPPLGQGALHMMRLTGTAQSNLDYSSEADMVAKMRVAVAFSPIISILCASSSLRMGGLAGYKSLRNWAWRALDPSRSGFLDFVFDDDFGYRRYIEYVVKIPMMVLEREGETKDMRGIDFVEFVSHGANGLTFEEADWAAQLGGTFPVARLRNAIETRTCDAGPAEMLLAQAAFWKGLMYDETSLREANELIQQEGMSIFKGLHEKAYLEGYDCLKQHPHRLALVDRVLSLAEQGLKRQGEADYLYPLREVVKQKESKADQLINGFIASESKELFPILKDLGLIFA